jgi:hypothetical protein
MKIGIIGAGNILDDRTAQHMRGPLTLDHSSFNLRNHTIAERIVISCVYDWR